MCISAHLVRRDADSLALEDTVSPQSTKGTPTVQYNKNVWEGLLFIIKELVRQAGSSFPGNTPDCVQPGTTWLSRTHPIERGWCLTQC